MLSKLRRHLSYANVAATLALVFSMSGAALAANHYLINSTKQINPKVLRKLKGNSGPKGATGATGTAGTAGAAGAKGAQGEQGPSHAWSNTVVGDATELGASVTVPAGNYVVSGTGRFGEFDQPESGIGYCELVAGGSEISYSLGTVPNTGGKFGDPYGEATIPTEGTVTVSAPTPIGDFCEPSLSSNHVVLHADSVTVVATQVGRLN